VLALELDVSGPNAQGFEQASATLIELAEKFHVMQTAGVDIGGQGRQGQIQGMANQGSNRETTYPSGVGPSRKPILLKTIAMTLVAKTRARMRV